MYQKDFSLKPSPDEVSKFFVQLSCLLQDVYESVYEGLSLNLLEYDVQGLHRQALLQLMITGRGFFGSQLCTVDCAGRCFAFAAECKGAGSSSSARIRSAAQSL